MSERPSIAREIADLMAAMPAYPAAPEVRAAWVRRKATVLRRIAAETDDPAHARRAAEQAADAERAAVALDAQAGAGDDPGSGAGS